MDHPARPASLIAHPSSLILGLALVALTAAVYAPVRHYPFLGYDDVDYVTQNPHVNTGVTRENLVWVWTSVHHVTWHPLTTLSHMLDCELFGLNAGPQHVHNVVLHLLNTLLLLGALTRMTAQPWRSLAVAGLFALHPLHVESVAWISERKDVLSTFFWLLTLWSYVTYVRRPSLRRYTTVLAAYVAALLSKPMVVTLPFVLLLLDVWPLRRVAWSHGNDAGTGRRAVSFLAFEKLPLLALAAAASVITFTVQHGLGGIVPDAVSPWFERCANAALAYAGYLRQMLWPVDLAAFYPFEVPLPGWRVVASIALLAAATLAVLWGARQRPYLFVGWFWYVGTLVPVIGFVRVGGQAMADRYTYVPLIGIFIIAVWGIADLLAGWQHGQAAGAIMAAAALTACTLLTARQVAFWQDDLHLFEHALAVTRDNSEAHLTVGGILLSRGDLDAALPHLAESLRLDPDNDRAHFDLGLLFTARGDLDAARQHYVAALQADPRYAKARLALGRVLAAQGHIDGALAHYRMVIDQEPDMATSHTHLDVTLEARFELARAYASAGHARAALAELEAVQRERPYWTAVDATLAWLLATSTDAGVRDGTRAVQVAEAAARRTATPDAEVLNSLAAAEAEAGRFTTAVDVATQALASAHTSGQTALEQALVGRLALYRAGQPVREPAGGTQ